MKKNKKRKAPIAPMPEQAMLICYTPYYVPDLVGTRGYIGYEWQDTDEDLRLLKRNLVFLDSRDARLMTEAMLFAIQEMVDAVTV